MRCGSAVFLFPSASFNMRLVVLLSLILHARVAQGLVVTGYVGESVVLSAGSEATLTPSKIDWYIGNNTFLASHEDKMTRVDWVSRYAGRLSLNISNGDLTIRNLNHEDALTYTAKLTYAAQRKRTTTVTQLTVRQQLQKPVISVDLHEARQGRCWLVLHCSSEDQDTALSWQVQPPSNTCVTDNGYLLASFNTSQGDVKVTCTCRRDNKISSSDFTPQCHDDEPKDPCPRDRCGICFFIGFITGIFITGIFFFEKVRAALKCCKR